MSSFIPNLRALEQERLVIYLDDQSLVDALRSEDPEVRAAAVETRDLMWKRLGQIHVQSLSERDSPAKAIRQFTRWARRHYPEYF